tara:strand:+ start:219 stop:593 length:375 start_codon:yes stop_codon:yes gene_type:complete
MNNYRIGSEDYDGDDNNIGNDEEYSSLIQMRNNNLINVYFMTIINLLFNIMFFFTLVYLSFYVPEIKDKLNELYNKLNGIDINNLLFFMNKFDDGVDELNINEIKQMLVYLLGNISHIEKRLHF